MGTVRDYRELRVYRVGFAAAMRVFVATGGWPREERYSLTDQVRRSSRSVCGCLAEAWQKRRYPASFVAKLIDARAEAEETCVWLDFAMECGYLSPEDHAELVEAFRYVSRMLTRMGANPDRWTPPSPPAL
jgi:four helix bundle protein